VSAKFANQIAANSDHKIYNENDDVNKENHPNKNTRLIRNLGDCPTVSEAE
jgi:hypothetical protein